MGEDGLFELLVQTINGEYKCKSDDIREIAPTRYATTRYAQARICVKSHKKSNGFCRK